MKLLSQSQSDKIRQSAKGEQCTLNIPSVCSYDPDKTVLCHLSSEWSGRGLKSPDIGSAIYADFECHKQLDDRSSDFWKSKDAYFYILRALQRTIKRMVEKGILKV